MFYTIQLIRFHISNQIHLRNRRRLDISWKRLLDNRRRLRVMNAELLKK